MNNIILSLLVVGLCATAGCTTNVRQRTYAPQYYDAADYYSWVTLASEEEILQEVGRLEAGANEIGSEESLVQLAVLISATTTDPHFNLLALDLLTIFEERAVSNAVESDYLAFAGLWRQLLELRQQSHSVDERLRTDAERIVELERERESLRAQIEALTSIEQQLDRREQVRGNLSDEPVQ